MAEPKLVILDPSRISYINIHWSKYAMVVVIMQVDESVEAIKTELQEKDGGNPGWV